MYAIRSYYADLDEATGFWAEALGLAVAQTEEVPAEGVNVAFLPPIEGVHINPAEINLRYGSLNPRNNFV